MLPTTQTDDPKQASRQQADFIMLRQLEARIPAPLFNQVLQTVAQSCDLPKRMDWTGRQRDLTFEELKVNFAQVDQNYLPDLLESNLTGQKNQKSAKLNINDGFQNNYKSVLSLNGPKNLLMRYRQLDLQRSCDNSRKILQLDEISRFERMKTVFGHCLIDEGCHAPIYNVKFDINDNFIISGADDCIVKIWDKHSMNLQASLHGHEDVITDIDISKCNRYLATASIDGKIIIWDWQNCKKIDEITDHRANVNNIKFFTLTTKSQPDKSEDSVESTLEEIQILVSCSEDGTVRVYDEIAYLEALANHEQSSGGAGRRSSRGRQSAQEAIPVPRKERFTIILQPQDFRAGVRNKKINTVHVNKNGIVSAGTDKGEVLIWELDVKAFRKSQSQKSVLPQQIPKFHGSFKAFTEAVHFCEFSPSGQMLFVGSDDGTAKIWNIEKGKAPNLSDEKVLITFQEKRSVSEADKLTIFRNNEGQQMSLAEHKKKKSRWDCDSIAWSVHGRYAIAAISGKYDEDKNHVYCFIKVWDSFTGELIQDIAKGTYAQLANSTFVLSPHPLIEEIFMTGGDGGTICLWNIKQRQLIKKFLEYGIYSYEKYTMNDPKCGRFSNDGSCFVVGSGTGTLSLFACDGSNFKYAATRVEQFYQMDDIKHNSNIYYELEDGQEPQVCGYSLIPYECQPPSPLIGKFKNARKFTHDEYERNLNLRQELSKDEEDFLLGQLSEGLNNDMYNPNNQGLNFQPDDIIEQDDARRGNRRVFNSQSDSSIEITGQRRNQQAERAPPRGGRRGLLQGRAAQNIMNPAARLNPNLDPDNSLYDRESDENFEVVEAQSCEEDDVMESVNEESSEDADAEQIQTRRRGRLPRRNVNVIAQDNDPRNNRRPVRGTRRQFEEAKVQTVRTRLRHQLNEIEASVGSDELPDDTYEMSDINDGPNTRRRQTKRAEQSNRRGRLPSSDDESAASGIYSEDDFEQGNRGVRTRAATQSKGKSKSKRNEAGRNLRTRGGAVNYNEEPSYDVSQSEEEQKIESQSSKEEVVTSKRKGRSRALIDDEDEEMAEQDAFVVEDQFKKQRGDEDYDLIQEDPNVQLQEDMIEQPKVCEFCSRSDGIIIGPFAHQKDPAKAGIRLYFHLECLEASNTTFYNQTKNKWMNIGKAMEKHLKKPTMCDRCGNIGATVKCTDCRKTYHGYHCSTLYMLYIDSQQYQCFECRNLENHNSLNKQSIIEKSELLKLKKAAPKDHLLVSATLDRYIPQLGDEVYYFFQGHEQFISLFNCFFYCGDQEILNFAYPWKLHQQLNEPTVCKIVDISHSFPSKNALTLIKKFGDKGGEVVQTPQIVTNLRLEISKASTTFDVLFFPSTLPDYLVPRSLYEESLAQYNQLLTQNMFIGQTFKKRGRDPTKYKILAVKNYEDCVNPDTNWETVVCQVEDAYRLRANAGRRSNRRNEAQDQDSAETISFWRLDLAKDASQFILPPLDEATKLSALAIISEYIGKKSDICSPFLERVPQQVAPDYREVIASEMYLTLITTRLSNNYYRSLNQLNSDIDLIYKNSEIYNSEEHDLTQFAKEICQSLKRSLRKQLNNSVAHNSNDDHSHQVTTRGNDEAVKITINTSAASSSRSKPNNFSSNPTPPLKNGRQARAADQSSEMEAFKKNIDEQQSRISRRQYQEEEKLAIPTSALQFQNPLLDDQTGSKRSRRSTRQNVKNVQSDMVVDTNPLPQSSNNSSSKITIMLGSSKQKEDDESLLGKATKSGRQRKTLRKNLKESSDEDSEAEFEDEAPICTGSKKRTRFA